VNPLFQYWLYKKITQNQPSYTNMDAVVYRLIVGGIVLVWMSIIILSALFFLHYRAD
jgi:hypothetical protein